MSNVPNIYLVPHVGLGRAFLPALTALGSEARQTLDTFNLAWLKVLNGDATSGTAQALEREAQKLAPLIEKLPEGAEQYEAALAIYTRVPRFLKNDALLNVLAKNTSVLLDAEREKLVLKALPPVLHEMSAFAARGKMGALSLPDQETLAHLNALKGLIGARHDEAVIEIVRECVYSLKTTATAPLGRAASRLNAIQGAVGQVAFFNSPQFRGRIAERLKKTRKLTRQLLGNGWTQSVILEGRIYTATQIPSGWKLTEYVDGALAVHEKAMPSDRMAQGFLDLAAQHKVEQRITVLDQVLRDELRRTPHWGSQDTVLFIPVGRGYRALQLRPPPFNMVPERWLIAAEGGVWPVKNNAIPAAGTETFITESPLTRDAARGAARFFLAKVRAALSEP